MKAINLKTLIDSEQLGKELYEKYLSYFGLSVKTRHNREGIKPHELSTIKAMVANLAQISHKVLPLLLEDFFVGYQIPQIGKEFDLLRFGQLKGSPSLINIELKSESTEEKILQQLLKNKYYLGFLEYDLYLFSYNQATNTLYQLGADNQLKRHTDFTVLQTLLMRQQPEFIQEIDKLFDPANYLVSPFNATEKFLSGEYFLTGHQKDIKENHIIPKIIKGDTAFMAITGGAGTGKTLLTYDIAKTLKAEAKRVLIVHCGILNDGQKTLEANDWAIISIDMLQSITLADYDVLIIDEAQRLGREEFIWLKQMINQGINCQCLFSYDRLQWLREEERNTGIIKDIEQLASYQVGLTDKIRTNPEIASFIKRLLNIRETKVSHYPYPNIKLHYVTNAEEAKLLLLKLKQNSWKVANYTPSPNKALAYESYTLTDERDNAHTIIGQEYDKVVAVLDESFYYSPSGTLTARSSKDEKDDYDQERMLYQILTRVRKQLSIIVINNPIILKRCLSILLK